MTRFVRVAGAQLGPIARDEARHTVVARLIALLESAAAEGADVVVFPELALTTFFPRWYVDPASDLDAFYERSMPSTDTEPLFARARELRIGFSLGYAELTDEGRRYNTTILVERDGRFVGRYRKVHVPGHEHHEPWRSFQHLERRYFEPGDRFEAWRAFGGIVGLATCNDRRWPETYRVLALQGCELVMIGYNTPIHYAPDPSQDRLAGFHNALVMQAGAYQNGMWVIGVAKGGIEEGVDSLAESSIVAPSGEIVTRARGNGDEVIVADCDLDLCANYKETLFDFDRYRRPDVYGLITQRRGASPPPPDDRADAPKATRR